MRIWKKVLSITVMLVICCLIIVYAFGNSSKNINNVMVDATEENIDKTTSTTENVETTEKRFSEEVSVWDGSIATSYESGDGTPENPYIIATADQLALLAQETNSGHVYAGQYFCLVNDIILNTSESIQKCKEGIEAEVNYWEPIGTYEHPFEAVFYGGNHSITGLLCYSDYRDYVGFFGCITNGYIQGVNLVSELIFVIGKYVGGIAGVIASEGGNSAIIENCSVDCTSTIVADRYDEDAGSVIIGGLIGSCLAYSGNVMVTGCINNATIFSDFDSDYNKIGGIVGFTDSSDYSESPNCYVLIKNCINYGEIGTMLSRSCTGGIVGETWENTQIVNCANIGYVLSDSSRLGSIVGRSCVRVQDGGYISNCWFIPEYCEYDCGDAKDAKIDIRVTSESNLRDIEWLSMNMDFNSEIWEIDNGCLRYIGN